MAKLTRDILILALLFVPICSCCLNKTRAAPIPKAKSRFSPRPAIHGLYKMKWHGTVFTRTELRGDGFYLAQQVGAAGYPMPNCWVGTWTLKGDVLRVEEKPWDRDTGSLGCKFFYTFTLKPGKLESTCGNFSLGPLK